MEVKMEDAAMGEQLVVPPLAAVKLEKSAYEILKESKTGVEEVVAKILSLKKDDQVKPEIRELVTQMFLHFVSLRQVSILLSILFLGFLELLTFVTSIVTSLLMFTFILLF